MTSCLELRPHRRRFDGMATWFVVVVVVLLDVLGVVLIQRELMVSKVVRLADIDRGNCSSSYETVDVRDQVRGRRHATAAAIRVDKAPCQSLPRELLRKILGPAYNPRYMSFEKPETPPEVVVGGSSASDQSDQNWQHHQRHRDGGRRRKVEAFHVHQGYTRILHEEPVVLSWADYLTPTSTTTGGTPRPKPNFNRKKQTQERPKTSTSKGHKRKQHDDKRHHRFVKEEEFEQVEPPPPIDQEDGRTGYVDAFVRKIRGKRQVKDGFPWACDSRIEWLDLGPNHFPRFLRSVVCTSGKCWFGHFQCRPKAFTVKILRRRKDSCVVTSSSAVKSNDDTFDANSLVPSEFREQWAFEERAVTFCCECAA